MADPKIYLNGEEPQDNEQPEEIVVVTGDKPSEPEKEAEAEEPDTDEDGDDGEDDSASDLRIAHEQRDEDVHERRKRERQERKERQRLARQRKDEQIDTLIRQNQELARRIEQLASNQQTQTVQSVEQRLGFARQHLAKAESDIVDATNRGDGAALAKALTYRDNAKAAIGQLEYERTSQGQARPAQQVAQQAPQMDPQVAQHAQAWAAANPWFDYNANTPEVMRVKAAERDLLNEGYNPKDRNFWAELSRRASGTNEGRSVSTTPRKGGPKVGGQPTAGNGRRTEYHLSEERVNAIKEAGAWDDPAARNRMIKAYREYDKQNPAR